MLLKDVPKIEFGPVEALHAKFEKEENESVEQSPSVPDHHYETYLFALAQMPGPDNKTGPGFQDTPEWLLGDRISPKSTSLIHESGWSLYKLLTARNDDLCKIGIVFEQDRKKILAAIRAFHLAPWRTIQTINLKPETTTKKHKEPIIFLLETFSRLTQQLYVDTATIAWLQQRIPKKPNERELLIGHVKEAINATSVLVKLTEGIHRRTKVANKKLPHHPVDYIGPKQTRKWPVYKRIILSSVFLVSLSVLSPVIETKLSQSVLRPFSRLPLKWCALLAWSLI